MSLGSMIALIKTLAGSGGGGGGTNVVANPTLAGTEADLTGLQVGDTKYKVGGGVLVVHADESTGALDKTWQEIYDASNLGVVVLPRAGEILYLAAATHTLPIGPLPEKWRIVFSRITEESVGPLPFEAESADSYPSYVGE